MTTPVSNTTSPEGIEGRTADKRTRVDPAKYMVAMAFIAYALNFIDRQIVSVLLEAIKEDLQISDGKLGLITGLGFALFYACVGIPIAWLSDRYSRKNIIAACMTIWSAATITFGMAQNFWQMLLSRMAVGVGESGFAPAAFSMISDYFPRDKRATAIAIATVGAMLGTTLGMSLGGVIADRAGWRAAMFIAGAPGLLFALMFYLTVKEPARGQSDAKDSRETVTSTTVEKSSFLLLARNPTYLLALAGASSICFVIYACLHWLPAFLIRSYDLSSSAAGLLLGPLLGGVGAVSMLSSGYITDRLSVRDVRWGFWLPALGALCAFPLLAAVFLVHHKVAALLLFGVGYYCTMFFAVPTTTIIQYIVPLRLRARATAIYLLITTLVGFGFGPLAAGYISEAFSAMGVHSLRYALLSMTPILLASPIILLFASKQLKASEHGQS